MNELMLVAPCEAPVMSSVRPSGRRPSVWRHSMGGPAASARRRIGMPTTVDANDGVIGRAIAEITSSQRLAIHRFARPGGASRLTSITGTPQLFAALTEGAATKPPN